MAALIRRIGSRTTHYFASLPSTIKNGRFNHENGLDMWLARGLGISSSARAARGDEEGDCGCADGYF
jgi:hypothetical protein